MNPNVNDGLCVMLTCECRLTDCCKRPTLGQGMLMGEALGVEGRGYMGLYILLTCAVNLKLP